MRFKQKIKQLIDKGNTPAPETMFASFLASATTAWALVSVRTPRAPRRLVARDAALDLAASEELFARYYGQAPEPQRSTYAKAWSIVEATFAAAGGDAMALDASAFGGALASFTTPGPSEAQLEAMPAEAAAIMRKLSDTAASYYRVTSPDLDWGTCYRTLNREVGARVPPRPSALRRPTRRSSAGSSAASSSGRARARTCRTSRSTSGPGPRRTRTSSSCASSACRGATSPSTRPTRRRTTRRSRPRASSS